MSIIKSNGAGESGGFYNGVATQSLRFSSGRSTRLEKTPNASSLHTWTWSGWVKRSSLGASRAFWSATSSAVFAMFFNSDDSLRVWTNGGNGSIYTKRLFRDTSAWYHIALTSKNSGLFFELYVNGIKLVGDGDGASVDFSYDNRLVYPGGDTSAIELNSNVIHYLGVWNNGGLQYFDGYLADVNFLDGITVGDTSGVLDEFIEIKDGVCIPKKYTGSYGTNGYRLEFKETGTGTASTSTIGADTSGQTNHYTSSGISAYDSNMGDNPENNFCTLNPLGKQSSSALTEGNLKAVLSSGGNSARTPSTFAVSSGKWYWEVRQSSSNRFAMGVFDADTYVMTNEDGGIDTREWVFVTNDNSGAAARQNSGSMTTGYGGTVADGHVVMVALDVDNGAIWFGKQGSWFNTDGSADSATVKSQIEAGTTTNSAYTSVTGRLTPSFIRQTSNNTLTVNFGQDSTFHGGESAATNADGNGNGNFQYAPPSGFLALCSANLPDLTIGPDSTTQANDYFNTVIYTGDDNANRGITGVGFKPDWLWHKSRDVANWHFLFDSSRGVDKRLSSNELNAEGDATGLDSFDADGFTVDHEASNQDMNASAHTYVAWNWKANGGTTTTNDASATSVGDIDSVYQANTTAGFSIVTWTGIADDTNNTIAHGLGVTPAMHITKSRSTNSAGHWMVWHQSFPDTRDNLFLNLTNATNAQGFGGSTPTNNSTVFETSQGTYTNVSGDNYVSYVFAEIEGYSKFGIYSGNGAADGTFAFLGFRPAWIMIKNTSAVAEFVIVDNVRSTFNEVDVILAANETTIESGFATTNRNIDFLSNGFKIRGTAAGGTTALNTSGSKYIYMAFAEAPFKYANAR